MVHSAIMHDTQTRSYHVLLGVTVVFALLAVVTMLPNPGASKPNVLGYRSVCAFAPAASALCGLLAGITCTVRNRRFSRNASSARYRPIILPAVVVLLLATASIVFGTRFGAAQRRFEIVIADTTAARPAGTLAPLAEGTRRATVANGDVAATVEVTVSGGSITAMRLVDGKNVDQPLAETIFSRIREADSLSVDAVSGATASSNVLLQAVGDAARAR